MLTSPMKTSYFKRKYINTGKNRGSLSSFHRVCKSSPQGIDYLFITSTLKLVIRFTSCVSILSSPSALGLRGNLFQLCCCQAQHSTFQSLTLISHACSLNREPQSRGELLTLCPALLPRSE